MAVLVQGGLPELLRELATELHDVDLSESADGTFKRAWVTRALYSAAAEVARRIRRAGVPPSSLDPYTFTLSVDPADSDRYLLPRRGRRVFSLKDGDDYYDSLDSGELGQTGFVYEGRAIRFRNHTVSGTITAQVLQDPVTPSYGQAGSATSQTSIVLAATPTIGRTAVEDDYYVGALIAMESGLAAGEIRRVTDYVAATKACTVSSFTGVPAENDYYTFVLDLPPCMERAVILRAALILLRTDKSLDAERDRIIDSYKEAYEDGVSDLRRGVVGHIAAIRQVWFPGFEEDGQL